MAHSALALAVLGCGASAQYYRPESRGISALARPFFPGGPLSVMWQGSFNSTSNPYAFSGPLITHPDGLKEQTFLSQPIDLGPGEVVNNYFPINWPEGKIRLKSYSGDIVKLAPDADAEAVNDDGFPAVVQATREEVYLHHWTVNKWQLSEKEFDSFKEKGNEVRGPPPSGANATYSFPDPYGLESDSDEMHRRGILMLFNAHLIDIRGVENRRGCVECDCKVTGVHHGGPNYTGGLECCHSTKKDGGKCPSDSEKIVQSYFVKYTLTWRDVSDAVYANSPFKPLNTITLDQADDGDRWFDPVPFPGSSKQTHKALKDDPVSMASLEGRHSGMQGEDGHVKIHFDIGLKPKPHITPKLSMDPHGCHVEYYVPECGSGEACVHRFQNSWTIPFDMEVVAVHNHLHGSAINMTTMVEGGDTICVGLPRYDGEWLVEVSKCTVRDGLSKPMRVKRGQTIIVETFYSQDERPHFGVMGYSMLYVHRLDTRDEKMMLV